MATNWKMLLKKTSRWRLPACIEVNGSVDEGHLAYSIHTNNVLQQIANLTMPAEADLESGIA